MTYAVYRFYNAAHELLYVGATKQLDKRIGEHKRAAPWYSEVATLAYQHYEDVQEAARAEYDAITQERPLYNQRTTRQLYSDPYPRHDISDHPDAEFVSLAVASRRAGRCVATLRQAIKRGKLNAIKVANSYFVQVDDLARYAPWAASPDHPRTGNRKPRKPATPPADHEGDTP